jgi:peptidoglycan/LPS O-acetylase OafA/YrhL
MNFHYLGGLELSSYLSWYRYGNLGVQLFFIISGFVIVQSLKGKTLGEFTTSRFIRLFPLFWILCTATYLLTIIVPHVVHLHLSDYFINMTMLPDVINGFFGHGGLIDASYWTLTIEFLFYAGIGIFCSLFSYKNIRYFLTAWLVFSMVAFVYHVDQNFYIKLFIVRHASYFIFGSSLALIATKQARNIYEKYIDWLLLFASAIYSVYIHQEAIPPYPNPNPLDTNIITILLIVFFISIPILVYLSRYVKNPKIIRGLAVVGGLTYPLYLLHQRIGNVAINYFTNIYNIPWNNFAIGFEVFIIGIAYILYLQDKKIRAWLRKKLVVRE